LKNFDQTCQKHGVSLSKNDLKKLMQQFAQEAETSKIDSTGFDLQIINYRKLSIQLGLHKESYNYLKKI